MATRPLPCSIPEDHIKRNPVIQQVAIVGERHLSHETKVDVLVEPVTHAGGEAQLVMTGDVSDRKSVV